MTIIIKKDLFEVLEKKISKDEIESIFFTMAQIFISEYRCGVEIRKDRLEIYLRNVPLTVKDVYFEFINIIKQKHANLYDVIVLKQDLFDINDYNNNLYFEIKD